jgi:NAD(P)-dependent dehydrogenase (short-subunit alcohol dehydrogenase family)
MTKSVIVTGGSRGIGAAISMQAAAAGYEVCVNYSSNEEAATNVVNSIRQKGGTAIAVKADMGVEADILIMFETVDKELAPLGALVNNAGITGLASTVENMSYDRLNTLFQLNVIGPFIAAREAIKRMSTKQGGVGGSIVNISSVAARIGSPGEYVDYAASKGAIDSMTLGLSKEVAEDGIRVNAVRPGIIDTEIHALSTGEPGRVDRIKGMVPMKRGGEADEIAAAVMWLISDEASYTNGALLDVSGGR